jgi:hypothetical protein
MSTIDLSLVLAGRERRPFTGAAPAPLRFVLLAGEALRVPRACASVSVLSGSAWITLGGRDIVLSPGEARTFDAAREKVIVSALGAVPLLVEVF